MAYTTQQHTVQRFDSELNQVAALVDQMGRLALDQLRRSLASLNNEDAADAHAIIDRDKLINDLDVQIDEQIFRLIARRQPLAKDLREILALGKVVADLERAGDETRKIAGLTVRFYEGESHPPGEPILRDIHTMAAYVCNMMEASLAAFAGLDVERAVAVLRLGDGLEGEFRSTLRRLSTFIMEDARNVGYFVDIVLGIRALDRFGVHAKNIAGHVIFLAAGEDVRHLSADAVQHLLDGRPPAAVLDPGADAGPS